MPSTKQCALQKITSSTKASQPTSFQFASPSHRLSQEELASWWPFQRLDPKKFPKPIKTPSPTYDESPM